MLYSNIIAVQYQVKIRWDLKTRTLSAGGGESRGGSNPPFGTLRKGDIFEQETVEFAHLVALFSYGFDGSESPLCHGATVEGAGRGKDLFLDLRSKA